MKASDTIIDEGEKLACSLIGELPYKDYKAVIDEACLHQAEISFKAGIEEVVEWLQEHSPIFIAGQDIASVAGNEIRGNISYYPIIRWLEWQSKLKEWGW